MKTLLLAACAATLSLGTALAGGEGWTDDFEAAKKQAAAENKDLLIDFTGSDWCGWCIKLNKEVFSHDVFKEGVEDKYVLVELDFPKDKSKLTEETLKQNAKLKEVYQPKGFPTILLADPQGKPYAKTGYQPGGPEKYVAHLNELQESKVARDEAFDAASKAEGVEKAKALVAALGSMKLADATLASSYSDTIEEIKAADPDDETGFVKKIELKEKFAQFETELNKYGQNGDRDAALKLVNETLAEDEFGDPEKQQITFIKAMILAEKKQFDEALTTLDAAKAIAPDSKLGARVDSFKEHISKSQAESKAPKTEEKKDGE
ncbi:thioredoxin family protein [Haloferula chungangensis]|uniref:Thioredoxin family protein n=1 Tax=Haloferula chungangensis TaxID=1048331 RepID=A0ABW2LC16_9BACT